MDVEKVVNAIPKWKTITYSEHQNGSKLSVDAGLSKSEMLLAFAPYIVITILGIVAICSYFCYSSVGNVNRLHNEVINIERVYSK